MVGLASWITRDVEKQKPPARKVEKEQAPVRKTVSAKFVAEIKYSSVAVWPKLSPDCRHIAYATRVGDKQVAVVDREEGEEYDEIMDSSIRFSPDSERVAYAAREGGKWVPVVDGKEGKEYDGVGALTFSPDSKHVLYSV